MFSGRGGENETKLQGLTKSAENIILNSKCRERITKTQRIKETYEILFKLMKQLY